MKTWRLLLQDLSKKVLSVSNLVAIGIQFIYVLVITLLLALMTSKPVRVFLTIIPVIYVLTIAALILARNAFLKSLNLEAVIFSLVIGLLIGNLFTLPDWFRKN